MISDDNTLGDVKAFLHDEVLKGTACPACFQHVQMYRWNLYSTAVRALILFYRLGGTTTFVHSRDLKDYGHKGHGDVSRLLHWGLVVGEKTAVGAGARSGYWRVTPYGEDFILGRVKISKYVWVYNKAALGFEGSLVDVKEALGTKFSYAKLMSPV